MRRFILIVAVTTVAVAKPELYREKEDFQYSRSSSDDGSKAGFYGAQRGNMGGNYERAHNMDGLAQHQMSSLVRQVQGELGDASKTRTGSVFTAANSRGVYGSGNYDLSNLEGRNFQEGVSYDDSHSHSALSSQGYGYNDHSSSASRNAGYSSNHAQNSHYSGYQGSGHSKQTIHSSNLQAAEDENSGSTYGYDRQAGYSSGHYSESAYHGQHAYDQSNTNIYNSRGHGSNTQTRLVSATPVRVVLRPGTRVAVPVAAQTYDATHSASSLIDQNSINSEAELLNNDNRHNYAPSSNGKHYESAYSYHKEWEKHDTKPVAVPLAVPTANPLPKHSELYDDTQEAHVANDRYHLNEADSQTAHSSNRYSGYSANVKSASSSQSRQQYDYNSRGQDLQSGSNSNAYTHGAYSSGSSAADLANVVGNSNSKPKSYQSSFAYHKSWERQGDPYEIKPDGQISQRLTAGTNNQAYTSHQYGSHYKQSHQSHSHGGVVDCDCDEDEHIRVARSYNIDQNQQYDPSLQNKDVYQGQEELGQQAQSGWENLEELGQQTQSKWDQLEDLGQQTESKWDNLENLGQQTQNSWDKVADAEQVQNKSDNLENLGQQEQEKWDKLEKVQPEMLEDLGQQTQSRWDNLGLEHVQTQENLEQQFQNKWDKIEQPEQQEQNQWDNPDVQKQRNEFTEKHNSNTNELQKFNQNSQSETTQEDKRSQGVLKPIQSTWDKLENSQVTDVNERNTEKHSQTQRDNENPWKHLFHDESPSQFSQNKDLKALEENEQGKHTYNIQKNSNNDEPKQDTSTNKQYEFSSFNNGGFNNPWSLSHDQNQHDNNFDYYQTTRYNPHRKNDFSNQFMNNNNIYSNYNSQTNPQTTSLQSLWDKINDRDRVNRDDKNVNGNEFQNSYSNSQQSYQNWRQTHNYNFESNLGVDQSSSNQNPTRSHYAGYRPWQTTIYDETTTVSTTKKPKEENQMEQKVKPSDIGRGDVEPEDLTIPTITSTEKSYTNRPNNPVIITTANNNNKPYKTPEEIDVLSLTKQTNKDADITQHAQEHNIYQNNNEQSDKTLSVISLSQQEWIEEQRQHGNTQNDKLDIGSTSTYRTVYSSTTASSPKFTTVNKTQKHEISNNDFMNTHIYINKPSYQVTNHTSHNSVNSNQVSHSNDNNNNKFHDVETTVEQAPEEINHKNTEQQSGNLDQDHKYFSQQQTNVEQLENFKPSNSEQKYYTNNYEKQQNRQKQQDEEQQFEDFGQQNENLNQQSQTLWGQDFENLQQSNAQQSENFEILNSDQKQDFYAKNFDQEQQSETQQLEDFKTSDDYQKQIFNDQKQHSSYKEQRNNQNIEKLQTTLPKNNDVEIITPVEATTEKPGFWKSVGNKLTNAKDKVSSWFRGS